MTRTREEQKRLQEKSINSSKIEAAIRGIGQGASLGFLPKIIAAGYAPFGENSVSENYRNALADMLEGQNISQNNNPKTFLAGELAGSLAVPMKTAATVPGRIGVAAGYGAASGAGNTYDGDVEDYLKSIGYGAALGGALGGTVEGATGLVRKGFNVSPDKVKTFTEAGLEPTAGATGNKFSKFMQSVSGNSLGGIGKFDEIAERTYNKINNFVKDMGGKELTREEGGKLAAKGLTKFKETNNEQVKNLKAAVDKVIPKETPVNLDPFVKDIGALKATLNPKQTEELLGNKFIKELFDASEGVIDFGTGARKTVLPYEKALEIKQKLGKYAFSNAPYSAGVGSEIGALKKLYGDLSEAMQQTANNISPEAGKLLKKYNRATQQNIEVNKKVEGVLAKAGKNLEMEGDIAAYTPEEVFNRIVSENGKVDSKTLARANKGLSPKEQKILGGNVIRQLGMDRTNGFSLSMLENRFKALEPEVQKRLLSSFEPKTGEQFKKILDAIDLNKNVLKEGNTSKTAYFNQLIDSIKSMGTIGMGAGGAALGLATGGLSVASAATGTIAAPFANNLMARFLTNPKIIDWLASSQNVLPNKAASHFAKLYGIAKEEPDLAPDIDAFVGFVRNNNDLTDEQYNSLDDTGKDRYLYNQLNNMSDEELFNFVDASSPEEKAKINSILNMFEPQEVGAQNEQQEVREPMNAIVPEQIEKPETNVLEKIKEAESGGNPSAKNKNSSASGLYQFTDKTFADMVKKYGKETGITMRDKNNPEAQEIMAEKLLAENKQVLEGFLNREAQAGELYLAHFLGADDAVKMLGSKPTAIAARLFPKAAKANREIFFDKGKPRTVAGVYNILKRKVEY